MEHPKHQAILVWTKTRLPQCIDHHRPSYASFWGDKRPDSLVVKSCGILWLFNTAIAAMENQHDSLFFFIDFYGPFSIASIKPVVFIALHPRKCRPLEEDFWSRRNVVMPMIRGKIWEKDWLVVWYCRSSTKWRDVKKWSINIIGPFMTGWWFQTWFLFSISYMGCHPSHWWTPWFFRGVGQPPTRRPLGSFFSGTLQ